MFAIIVLAVLVVLSILILAKRRKPAYVRCEVCNNYIPYEAIGISRKLADYTLYQCSECVGRVGMEI